MKKNILLILTVCLSSSLFSQGVQFENLSNWRSVLEKAKKENKYIFVDCFTTWCTPCKKMDADVYPLKDVGDYYNSHFISVKLQMDKTVNDDSIIKKWYGTAAGFQKNYSVNSFPTFLFFSPDGTPAHKIAATKSPEGFIQLGKDAQDPGKQYYSILKNFEPGKLDTADLKGLAQSFAYSDPTLAGKLATDYLSRIPSNDIVSEENLKEYISFFVKFRKNQAVKNFYKNYISQFKEKDIRDPKNRRLLILLNDDSLVRSVVTTYINGLSSKKLYANGNIELLLSFTATTKDRGFAVFKDNAKRAHAADTVFPISSMHFTVKAIIYNEAMKPYVNTLNGKPDWQSIETATKQYGPLGDSAYKMYKATILYTYEVEPFLKVNPNWTDVYQQIKSKLAGEGEEFLVGSSITYYMNAINSDQEKNCSNFIEAAKVYDERFLSGYRWSPSNDSWMLNNWAWMIFSKSNNSDELNTALNWSSRAISVQGSKDPPLAGVFMDTKANILYKLGRKEEAISLELKAAEIGKDPDIKVNLKKMQQGIPTWPVK